MLRRVAPPRADPEPRRSREKKAEADAALLEAKETGTAEDVEKYGKRTIKVTKEHNEECKKLLRLMGVPVVEAPCEAEASCAALCAAGRVFAAASDDMDTLTFGTPKLARNLMKPASAETGILEFDYAVALRELGLTREQFVDLCILCGCDYTDAIRGVGPVTALKLIKEHGSIEKVLAHLKDSGSKWVVPDPFPFEAARRLFLEPEVVDVAAIPEFKWLPPDEEGLVAFLVGEKSFSEERVRKAVEKMKAAKSKASQNRMESFFGCVTSVFSAILCCERAHALPQGADGGQVDHGAQAPSGRPKGQGQGRRGRSRWCEEKQGRRRRVEEVRCSLRLANGQATRPAVYSEATRDNRTQLTTQTNTQRACAPYRQSSCKGTTELHFSFFVFQDSGCDRGCCCCCCGGCCRGRGVSSRAA
jgi:flap endonuclease-1